MASPPKYLFLLYRAVDFLYAHEERNGYAGSTEADDDGREHQAVGKRVDVSIRIGGETVLDRYHCSVLLSEAEVEVDDGYLHDIHRHQLLHIVLTEDHTVYPQEEQYHDQRVDASGLQKLIQYVHRHPPFSRLNPRD